MTFKLKSSGLPFKEIGSSPAKQKGFDIKSEKAKNKRDFKKTSYDLGTPGWEPPVRREELDEKGKKIYDAHRAKKKKSPAKTHEPGHDNKETVSKTSPGEGWTKTKGTNIWAPPKADKHKRIKGGLGMKRAKVSMKKAGKRTMTKKMRPVNMKKMPIIQPGHTSVGELD